MGFRQRLGSFRHAIRGVSYALKSQPNLRIHAGAVVAVCVVGVLLALPASAWCWLVLAMGLVWSAELLNSALESLADAAVPEQHPAVGRAKDMAAGAVLATAVAAATIGLLVLGPPLWRVVWSAAG